MAYNKQRNVTKSSKRKINGIVKLKNVLERLVQKSLLLTQKQEHEDGVVRGYVPRDVKEGHFAVIAVDEYEPRQRFVVPLAFLENPVFLRLLEQAAEEYGFDHNGALMVPCRPSELRMILSEQ
ncbi:PREDICTED: auxin-induced protein 15A [Tarenaya hassleriana]|uniref:auxin-induced protein 15A n=1 Tax=Tarenaya hassleriana TaxID=28532 RepID=UPI00053C3470|nr:PREDICTED: auxin-induced protein 15A [Tarenaya hassleriana]